MTDASALNPRPLLGPRETVFGDPRFSLENINTALYPDGQLAWVRENKTLYALDATSTAAPSGTNIVEPSAGPGRWFAQLGEGISGGLEQIVASEGDLPDPVGGVITLPAACYVIVGTVTITPGIQIRLQDGAVMSGRDRNCSILVGDTTSPAPFIITDSSANVTFSGLTVRNLGTGTVVSHDGGPNVANLLFMNSVVDGNGNGDAIFAVGTQTLGLFQSDIANVVNGVVMDATAPPTNFGWTDGFLLVATGVGVDLGGGPVNIVLSDVAIFMSGAATGLLVPAAVAASDIGMTLVGFQTGALGTAIEIEAGATVHFLSLVGCQFDDAGTGITLGAGATADARIVACDFRSATAAVSGAGFSTPPEATPGWVFRANVGIPDTRARGGIHLTASDTLASPGGLLSTLSPLAADTDSTLFSLGTGGQAGQLVYNGNEAVRAQVTAIFFASLAVAANITAQIQRNGSNVEVATTVGIGVVATSVVVQATVLLNPGDDLDVNVTNGALLTIGNYSLNAVA